MNATQQKSFQELQNKQQNMITATISKFPTPKKQMGMGDNIIIFDFKNNADYEEAIIIADSLTNCRFLNQGTSKKRITLIF